MSGTELCYHHSTVKSALGKWTPPDKAAYGEFTAIPFIFPEDRASLQIDYFLLFRALTEERVERRAAEVLFRMLKAMAANLGKLGTLVEASDQQERVQGPGTSDQKERAQGPGTGDQKDREQGPAPRNEGRTVNLHAAAAKLPPEACFQNVPASASPAFMSMGKQAMQCVSAEGQRMVDLHSQPRMGR